MMNEKHQHLIHNLLCLLLCNMYVYNNNNKSILNDKYVLFLLDINELENSLITSNKYV